MLRPSPDKCEKLRKFAAKELRERHPRGVVGFVGQGVAELSKVVADFLNRLNGELTLGCLMVDRVTGQVRLRAEALLHHSYLPESFIDSLLSFGTHWIDRLIPSLSLVVHAGLSPAEAASLLADAETEECH